MHGIMKDRSKTQYVVGFAYNRNQTEVLLVEKKKPSWQKNRFNGIGGKVEDNETVFQAMQREFEEETGIDISDWKEFAICRCPDCTIYFFKTVIDCETLSDLSFNEVNDIGEYIFISYIIYSDHFDGLYQNLCVWPSGWLIFAGCDKELSGVLEINYRSNKDERQ